MPPYRPPSLSRSTSDDETDMRPSHESKLPAAAIEQNSDQDGTGADVIALTHTKRTVFPDMMTREVGAVCAGASPVIIDVRAPCAVDACGVVR
ncbi:hypothetical protein DFH09DRAFT_1300290 [Mycena vulgaris]|nr:hypothetical protein DFH09DRAFT_1300290 [Mycena vulgaris]